MHPWDRQPYDTDESWPVFQAFRDQRPPRRDILVQIKGRAVDPYKVSVWFREHFWKARVVEWDKHLDEIRQYVQEEQLAQHVQAVTAEHMAMLANARDIVAREMEKLLATVRESPAETLKVRDLIRLAETVIRGDRLVRDQTTEKVETQMDLSHLSEAELAEIERKLTGGATSGD